MAQNAIARLDDRNSGVAPSLAAASVNIPTPVPAPVSTPVSNPLLLSGLSVRLGPPSTVLPSYGWSRKSNSILRGSVAIASCVLLLVGVAYAIPSVRRFAIQEYKSITSSIHSKPLDLGAASLRSLRLRLKSPWLPTIRTLKTVKFSQLIIVNPENWADDRRTQSPVRRTFRPGALPTDSRAQPRTEEPRLTRGGTIDPASASDRNIEEGYRHGESFRDDSIGYVAIGPCEDQRPFFRHEPLTPVDTASSRQQVAP